MSTQQERRKRREAERAAEYVYWCALLGIQAPPPDEWPSPLLESYTRLVTGGGVGRYKWQVDDGEVPGWCKP